MGAAFGEARRKIIWFLECCASCGRQLIVQEAKKRKCNEGYNVAIGEYEDMVKVGVVDPTKVDPEARLFCVHE
jgi:chaperonin GroEL (HSP60 family)